MSWRIFILSPSGDSPTQGSWKWPCGRGTLPCWERSQYQPQTVWRSKWMWLVKSKLKAIPINVIPSTVSVCSSIWESFKYTLVYLVSAGNEDISNILNKVLAVYLLSPLWGSLTVVKASCIGSPEVWLFHCFIFQCNDSSVWDTLLTKSSIFCCLKGKFVGFLPQSASCISLEKLWNCNISTLIYLKSSLSPSPSGYLLAPGSWKRSQRHSALPCWERSWCQHQR